MKNTIYLFLALLLASACKKDKASEGLDIPIYQSGSQEKGLAQGIRDGRKWDASGFGIKYIEGGMAYIGLVFNTFTEFGDLRENLLFNEVPPAKGKYPIKMHLKYENDGFVGTSYGLMEDDGDVAGALYQHDTTKIGYLEVLSVDTVSKEVQGYIDVVAFSFQAPENAPYPEKVTFKNLSFKVKIE